MSMKRNLLMAGICLAAFVSGASAAVLPNDFDAEHGGAGVLNYTGFAAYTVSTGSVDLIGNGFFDNFPGNGLYVDLAGSTGAFGALTTTMSYGPGTYLVTVGLGGTIYSGITDGATISWGTGSQNYVLPGLASATYQFMVTLTSATQFTIADDMLSGNPNIGATLFGFDVQPVNNGPGVPEPLTLSLFGAGLLGAAGLRRRAAKKIA